MYLQISISHWSRILIVVSCSLRTRTPAVSKDPRSSGILGKVNIWDSSQRQTSSDSKRRGLQFFKGSFAILEKVSSFRSEVSLLVWVLLWESHIGEGHWGFRFCGFGYFLDRFFGFCAKKTSVSRFWCLLQFADFPVFRIWFSVFAKNINGFRIDIQCGFRFFQFDLFGFRFLFDLSGSYTPPLISNSS